jgi:hypothetical protein
MAWPWWILLVAVALGAAALLSLHLLRFRYSFDYVFPTATEGRMEISFLFWRKVIPFGDDPGETSGQAPVTPEKTASSGTSGVSGTAGASTVPDTAGPGPRPGQEGFLAVPFKERVSRLRSHFKQAGKKWILDLAVWGHLVAYLLRSGFRALRFAGPSLQNLHVGSADVANLGRFAAAWSGLRAAVPFLACPVEYGFNERPFALRLKVGGGCTALGLLTFLLALVATLPWVRLFRRFAKSWRNPALDPWQRKLVSALA